MRTLSLTLLVFAAVATAQAQTVTAGQLFTWLQCKDHGCFNTSVLGRNFHLDSKDAPGDSVVNYFYKSEKQALPGGAAIANSVNIETLGGGKVATVTFVTANETTYKTLLNEFTLGYSFTASDTLAKDGAAEYYFTSTLRKQYILLARTSHRTIEGGGTVTLYSLKLYKQ